MINSQAFSQIVGRTFDTWIQDGGRTNGKTAGDEIYNPAYIIESIWRDELGLGDSDIDVASVDALGNTSSGSRRSWQFSKPIFELENAEDIIARICLEAHIIQVKEATGKRRLVALDTNASTPYTIEQSQMVREPYIRKSHHSAIRNQFEVNYRRDYALNAFEKTITVNESASDLTSNTFTPADFTPNEDAAVVKYGNGASTSLCGVSQTRFKKIQKLNMNLEWVRDTATANLWTKKIIEWRYAPLILLDTLGWFGDTSSLSLKPFILYELGDQCYIQHPLLDDGISNEFVFMVTGKTIYKNERLVKLNLTQMR